jgi:hypothetical protein
MRLRRFVALAVSCFRSLMSDARRHSISGFAALSVLSAPQRGHLMMRQRYSPVASLRLQCAHRMFCMFRYGPLRCARMRRPRARWRGLCRQQCLVVAAGTAGMGRGRCCCTDHVVTSFFLLRRAHRPFNHSGESCLFRHTGHEHAVLLQP